MTTIKVISLKMNSGIPGNYSLFEPHFRRARCGMELKWNQTGEDRIGQNIEFFCVHHDFQK